MSNYQVGDPWYQSYVPPNYGFLGCFHSTPKPTPGVVNSTLFGSKVIFTVVVYDSEKQEYVTYEKEGIITTIWAEFPDNLGSSVSILKFAVLQPDGILSVITSDNCRVIET